MPNISEARAQASRINGQMSRGPKTPEGKAISRANSLKHGLTGEGVVIPDGDVEAINIRISHLESQLKPRTEMGTVFVGRIGVLTVRLDRCTEQAADVVATHVKKALRDFDDHRLDAADALFESLAEAPSANFRKLGRTEEGLQRLILGYTELKVDLLEGRWRVAHGHRMAHLRGCRADDCTVAALIEISQAVLGQFDPPTQALADQVNAAQSIERAKSQLAAIIDEEVVGLENVLATLDPADLNEARADAIAAARLEAAPAVHQIQKYEAAAERSLFRTMKEARLVESAPSLAEQARTIKVKTPAANPVAQTTSAPVGSFSQPVAPPATPPETAPEADETPLTDKEMALFQDLLGPTTDEVATARPSIRKAGEVGAARASNR